MLNNYPDTFALVQIHTGGDAYILWGGYRAGFYGLFGTPTAWFDGYDAVAGSGTVAATYQLYLTRYNLARAVPTDVTIDLTADPLGAETYLVHANVCIEGGGAGKSMRVYMVQVQDLWPIPPTYSRNGLRQAAVAHNDTPTITLDAGECQVIDGVFDLSASSSSQEDIQIIAWAQTVAASAPAQIHQAAIMPWPFPSGDCNSNGVRDDQDISMGTSIDCDGDALPDECFIPIGSGAPGGPFYCDPARRTCDEDCNSNGIPDACDVDLVILEHPAATGICDGGTGQLQVTAVNPATASFQWAKDGMPLSDDVYLSGTDTDTLTISDADAPRDEGAYTCHVADGCLEYDSAPAQLTVLDYPAIVTQPQATRFVCRDEGVAFNISATGDWLQYQWYSNGEPLTSGGKYAGVTTEQLWINDVTIADQGNAYTCVVSNQCEAIESDAGILNVVTPVFLTEPRDACGETGGTVVLTASATSPNTVYYQWRKGSTSVGTGDTLTLSNVQAADAGDYYALAYTLSPTCTAASPTATVRVAGSAACTHAGDMFDDGDVDLADMQLFQQCFGVDVAGDWCCGCANVDSGNDIVDIDDWSAMQSLIDGPQ